MSTKPARTMDANEAVASVAYRLNDIIAIYPITPASVMGELCDEWATQSKPNVWSNVPTVVEMQSEGGAAGAVHGALTAGSLATTFTASQGLLLMLPNMFKLAGELTPFVMHVAARTVATHALSIFCDHSDVMACRQTGFALLASSSVQEAQDFACIAQAATLRSRVPFLHFFDGFRTSHELTRVTELTNDDLRALIDEAWRDERLRAALSPDHPTLRGTAQNPDTFFQAREAANSFYRACPELVDQEMTRFAARTGRRHHLFDYFGHEQPRSLIVVMGSASATVEETVHQLVARGSCVGVVRVALYRPFSVEKFLERVPPSVTNIAVLDRTKEPGAVGEPLYLDVIAALAEGGRNCKVIGGRYGLSSKELTPAMVAAVFGELAQPAPRRHFTVGITDDVTRESLDVSSDFRLDAADYYEAVFFGLGSDGTVGANKNTVKIVGDSSDRYVQGYFVYDSKKAGAVTVSHLRFGTQPFQRPYLITQADFVGCHQFEFLERLPVLEKARPGATLLVNSPYGRQTWEHLAREVQQEILDKRLRVYVIDAYRIAVEHELGRHINTVMQACFFSLSNILPVALALEQLKLAVEHSYGKKSAGIAQRNVDAIEATLSELVELPLPSEVTTNARPRRPIVPSTAPSFVQRVTAAMLAGHGDMLPVSAFPVDGTWPTGTSRWEKRDLGAEIPNWDPQLCIQCNKCVLVCPHAAIRAKVYEVAPTSLTPVGFKVVAWKGPDLKGESYALQVSPDDCTGCKACVEVCPAKDKQDPSRKALAMVAAEPQREAERKNYDFFLSLPEVDRSKVHLDVKGSQLLLPMFEYSGACAGCGETPYLKLLTQLFGDRALIANATGCSSIYGANLPTTPYTTDALGRGPAWSNSLFEDNAEFGFGMRLSVDAHAAEAKVLLQKLAFALPEALVSSLTARDQRDEPGWTARRSAIRTLREKLRIIDSREARRLDELADYLLEKSVWLVGGDGWAFDIGFGGLDHVLASDRNVNVLVLDTEVYSNTGGQKSKATPLGAAAKFAASGKETPKKDLGLHAMIYGHVYVASVAFGAKDAQTVRAFVEAESYPGPSLIIAYAHCIAHGYDLALGPHQQKLAVDSGVWPLYRFDPRRISRGEALLTLDSAPGKATVSEYMQREGRFRTVERANPEQYREFCARAEREAAHRTELYQQLSHLKLSAAAAR